MKHLLCVSIIFTLCTSACYQVRQTWRVDEAKKASLEMVRSLKHYLKKTGKPGFVFVKEFSYEGASSDYKDHSPLAHYVIDGLTAERIKFKAYNNRANINDHSYSVATGGHVSPTVLLYGLIRTRQKNVRNTTETTKYIFILELKDLRTKKTLWQSKTGFF